MLATASPTPDAAPPPVWKEVYNFLSLLLGEGQILALRPIETWTDGDKKKSSVVYKSIQFVTCHALFIRDAVDRQLAVGEAKRANIFFGVCPRFGADGRFDKAWQIRRVSALWADLDHCSPERAIENCNKAGLPRPSIIVNSGNGVHLYWLLDSPYLIDDVGNPAGVNAEWIDQGNGKPKKKREWIANAETGERLYLDVRANVPPLSAKAQHVQDVLQGIAAEIGGDSTHDLARLLRLPGTLNRKDERNGKRPVPCEIVELDATRRYPIGDFERFANQSPAKAHREKVAAVLLPAPRKLTPSKRDKLSDLVNTSAMATIGERSERDFDLCCFAIKKGIPQADVWATVKGVGKFAEAGEPYFLRTWTAAEQEAREQIWKKVERKHGFKQRGANGHASSNNHGSGRGADQAAGDTNTSAALGEDNQTDDGAANLSNFIVEFDEEGKPQKLPRPLGEIIADWRSATGDWPRRVDAALFVQDASGGVNWLGNAAALFGWASASEGVIEWGKGTGFTTKEEFFAESTRTATPYEAIETLPHFPAFVKHFYTSASPSPGSGDTLRALLDRFAYSTPIDRDLHLAGIATVFWGGAGGCRPAFVVTSDSGRGAGKTKLVEMTAHVAGGSLEFSAKDDIAEIKSRLLSTEGMSRRIASLDNIKSLRFSWAEFEGLITAAYISGKRMYVGEGRRPNLVTWFLTLNGASLSTDVAQRCVIIKLDRPDRSGGWEEDTRRFIVENRDALLSDVAAFFASPAYPPRTFSRWASWEKDVLSRLPDPAEAQRVILERQAEADTEKDDHEHVEDYFAERLKELGYDVACGRIFIPSEICCRWFNWATNESHRTAAVTNILKQAATEGVLKRIKTCGRHYGRGFIFVGVNATPGANTWTNVPEKIAELMKKRRDA